QSEQFLALVRACGVNTNAVSAAALQVPDSNRAAARQLLMSSGWNGETPLIGIAPGAAYGGAKRWPVDQYADLIARIPRELGATAQPIQSTVDGRQPVVDRRPPGCRFSRTRSGAVPACCASVRSIMRA